MFDSDNDLPDRPGERIFQSRLLQPIVAAFNQVQEDGFLHAWVDWEMLCLAAMQEIVSGQVVVAEIVDQPPLQHQPALVTPMPMSRKSRACRNPHDTCLVFGAARARFNFDRVNAGCDEAFGRRHKGQIKHSFRVGYSKIEELTHSVHKAVERRFRAGRLSEMSLRDFYWSDRVAPHLLVQQVEPTLQPGIGIRIQNEILSILRCEDTDEKGSERVSLHGSSSWVVLGRGLGKGPTKYHSAQNWRNESRNESGRVGKRTALFDNLKAIPFASDRRMSEFSVPDLCDDYPNEVHVLEPILRGFGGRRRFGGEVVTIKCFEDNSLVKELAGTPGRGRVMVVDGGGSKRRALLGDMIAAKAVENGWSGLVIFGCVRDVEALKELDLGVHAMAAYPVKTEKRGLGDQDVAVRFGGVTFRPGDYVYADENGVICAARDLLR